MIELKSPALSWDTKIRLIAAYSVRDWTCRCSQLFRITGGFSKVFGVVGLKPENGSSISKKEYFQYFSSLIICFVSTWRNIEVIAYKFQTSLSIHSEDTEKDHQERRGSDDL